MPTEGALIDGGTRIIIASEGRWKILQAAAQPAQTATGDAQYCSARAPCAWGLGCLLTADNLRPSSSRLIRFSPPYVCWCNASS